MIVISNLNVNVSSDNALLGHMIESHGFGLSAHRQKNFYLWPNGIDYLAIISRLGSYLLNMLNRKSADILFKRDYHLIVTCPCLGGDLENSTCASSIRLSVSRAS